MAPNSLQVSSVRGQVSSVEGQVPHNWVHHADDHQSSKDLDAGALFVLKSRGSWVHSGYHLTTSIVGPVIFSFPFTFRALGWVGGVLCLSLVGLITFYAYILLSIVLEHHASNGHRLLRFRDMGNHILGPGWGKYLVGPLQFAICYGAVIATILLGGQSLKFIYLLYQPTGKIQLYQFIIIFTTVPLLLAQIPSFHSLRHINFISLLLCFAYSAFIVAGAIHIGTSKSAPNKDYSIEGSQASRILNAINGISIIATTYGCGIIPEIQATLAPPVTGKMLKGLCMCYGVIVTTYFSVAISGYWAFGNEAQPAILANFTSPQGNHQLLPTWFLLLTNIFVLLQLLAITVIYLQPTNELFESLLADAKKDQFSVRNVVPRLISRSLTVIVAAVIAAMFPFFGDIMALFGAFGIIPVDFILPMIFYNVTFKPSKQGTAFWVNTIILVGSFGLVGLGAVASVRQMVLDAKKYSLFANM